MKKFIVAIALVLSAIGGGVFGSSVSAAPITCPKPQVATHTDNGWFCVNNGGNTSGAAETKNPND